ncbi:MAG: phosphate ABC transporter permease subunit PstC [Eubacterium sp.]|nr:phosphate ABC transporter permease subunit PstC [Eubacterium sp.]
MLNFREKLMKIVFLLTACVSIAAVFLICFFLLINGLPAMKEIGFGNFIFGKQWLPMQNIYGIFPMIVGSLYVTAGAILIGVPIGVFTSVYLVKFCPKGLYKIAKPAIDLMAGVPSIVYGFFGMIIIVPFVQNVFGGSGKGILTASILLGIMILPTIINVVEANLRAVPNYYYEGALALGASEERSAFFVLLPAAKSGVLAGIALGLGRAVGETMAVIMVAGNQAIMPQSVVSGVRTLTANIVLEMGYAADLHKGALIATAVVLFIFVLIINGCFTLLKRGKKL